MEMDLLVARISLLEFIHKMSFVRLMGKFVRGNVSFRSSLAHIFHMLSPSLVVVLNQPSIPCAGIMDHDDGAFFQGTEDTLESQ